MSTNPTDLPGQTAFTSSIPISPSFADRMRMRERNELTVETDANLYSLPKASMHADYDAVRITTADLDVLDRWLTAHGGTVTVTPAGDGVQVWTLRTATDPWPDGSRVVVLVSVVVPASELMWPELRAAVAA